MGKTKSGSKRLRSTYLTSVVSIALVLFMLGMLGMLVLDAKKISDYVKEHVQLNVFLNDGYSPPEISALQDLLSRDPSVKSVRYITKEEALDSLKKDLGENATGMLDANPLPASFELKLNAAYTHPDSVKKISDRIGKEKLVREVTWMQTEVDSMNRNFQTIALVILVFCALLFFIAVVLINSSIRLAMYSRRFLIKSMQLVGATKGFIRWPFLRRGFRHGFYAGLLSCILLAGLLYLIRIKLPELVQPQDLQLNGILFAGVIVLGVIISTISTFFAVNRYLRLKLDELFT